MTERFINLDAIDYYDIVSGNSSLNKDEWIINQSKKHAFKIYSDYDAVDDVNEKIILPPSSDAELLIDTFSDKLKQVLENTKIVDNQDGTESVELELEDRIVTLIIDQSGSMTWNDVNGFRFDIAQKIIQDLDQNYPGNIKYNIVKYGAVRTNIVLFGVKDDGTFNPNDVDSISAMYLTDNDSNFAGIRIVRNVQRVVDGETLTYPISPIDGDIVTDSFMSKYFDDDLEEDTTYYYKIYTYDINYKFSNGIPISVTPRDRVVPRGVSLFFGFNSSNNEPIPLIGSGVQRDENTVGLWHFNEGKYNRVFDFSDSKANLLFNDSSPRWVEERFVPSGTSGLVFNGVDNCAYVEDIEELSFSSSDSFTIMAWIFPIDDESDHCIISNYSNSIMNYSLYQKGKKLYLIDSSANESYTDDDVLEKNKWQFISVVYNNGVTSFYINGTQKTCSVDSFSPLDSGSNYIFSIGAENNGSLISDSFLGRITEVSIHNTNRSISYIQNNVEIISITDEDTGEVVVDPITGEDIVEARGLSVDNGDRLVVFKYAIPENANYLDGSVIIVRNKKNIPSWEGDGETVYQNDDVEVGTFYATDPYDFVLGQNYYYRIYTKNSSENYSYPEDSLSQTVLIPIGIDEDYLPDLQTDLEGPSELSSIESIIPGNKKILLRWSNDISDDRIKRVNIYYSFGDYPTLNDDGGSNSDLLYSGDISETEYVHRNIENDVKIYYTIANIDKYGRNSSTYINLYSTPSEDADESQIPLKEIENIHYEIVNNESISLIWDSPVKRDQDIDAYFDETILLYATITDEFGRQISEDTPIEITLEPTISREDLSKDVFSRGPIVSFTDDQAYRFITSDKKDGFVRASLKLEQNGDILSQIKDAKFEVKIKTYIPSNSVNNGETASDRTIFVGEDNSNEINSLVENSSISYSGGNIFEYISNSIIINFTNPWNIELVNKNNKKVIQKCYYYIEGSEGGLILASKTKGYDGVYIRASNPFIARARVWYKNEPVSSGSVNIAIWDADADLCAGSFTSTNISDVIIPQNSVLPVVSGVETISGVERSTSYVDIPLYAPSLPRSVVLFVKSRYAGFSSRADMNIVFQNILNIDLNANSPISDGENVAEQQASVYIINPDYPLNKSLYTYPENDTIVEWNMATRGTIDDSGETVDPKYLYSLDNVPLGNGVYSYTRNGLARNVFVGPFENKNNDEFDVYEISAKVLYEGLSGISKREIYIRNDHQEELKGLASRFLMEMEYGYKGAIFDRLWTDGKDYKKLYICRDAANATISEFRTANLFRTCASEEDSEFTIFELNPSGQIVSLSCDDEELEFLWGEIYEYVDEYTGEKYLEKGENGYSSYESANIDLNDKEESDKTVVYVRCNKFTPDSDCKEYLLDPDPSINLPCMKLRESAEGLGNTFVSGETYLFVNGSPVKLSGGGNFKVGVPPCPICYNEPLRIKTIWTKVDGEDTPFLGSFEDNAGESLLTISSYVDIRVEVSFCNNPVPEDTPVYIIVGNNNGRSIFNASNNIVFTETISGRSYADARIIINKVPEEDTGETIQIYSDYDRSGSVSRKASLPYTLVLNVEDVSEVTPLDPLVPTNPITNKVIEPKIYTKTLERYNIDNDEWEYATNMTVARAGSFVSSNSESEIFVISGVIDNSYNISSVNEKYNPFFDEWEFVESIPTERFGGMTVQFEDKIYTIGGIYFDEENDRLRVSRSVEVYDTINDSWDELSFMPIVEEDTVDEKSYGIAYGAAIYVQIEEGSTIGDYIYVLSGVTNFAYDSSDKIKINELNDRILRYSIDRDEWEYTRVLYSNELNYYQRISPLAINDSGNIIVFNGAFLENNNYTYSNEVFSVFAYEDIDSSKVIAGGGDFGTLPVPKFESVIVENETDISSGAKEYYILGGANNSSQSLDIVEKIDTSSSPYQYQKLTSMTKARNGLGAAFCSGTYLADYLYFMGEDGYCEIPNIFDKIGNSDFSIEFWMKVSSEEAPKINSPQYIFDFTNSDEGIRAYLNTDSDTSGFLQINVIENSSTHILQSSQELCDNKQHHIVITYDEDGNLNLYIDNQLDQTLDVSSYADIFDNNSLAYLCARNIYSSDIRIFNFEGFLFGFAIYKNKLLSLSEINDRYGYGIFEEFDGSEDGISWATNFDLYDGEYTYLTNEYGEYLIKDVVSEDNGYLYGDEDTDFNFTSGKDIIGNYIYIVGGKTSGRNDGFVDINFGNDVINFSDGYESLRCRLDGKQSISIPISLKKNGEYLSQDIQIAIRAFLKFGDTDSSSVFDTDQYQKQTAKLLEDKTIVYPVSLSLGQNDYYEGNSAIATIEDGQGVLTILPRSEDILIDVDSIAERLKNKNLGISEDEEASTEDTQIVIKSGVIREPYKISIEITILDPDGEIYGQTKDSAEESSSKIDMFGQDQKQLTNNLLIEYYSDIEWIPSIEKLLYSNDSTSTEAIQIIDNLSNEIPFGSSAMYDAIVSASEILSVNSIDSTRKVIYILTDNDSNMSIYTSDYAIDEVNAIDGFRKVPIISGNIAIAKPVTLSVQANQTDTVFLNKLGYFTGGQSVTIVSEDYLDDIVSIFYGEAAGALGYGTYQFVVDLEESVKIQTIEGVFDIPDSRSNANWKIEYSIDGYNYTEIEETFSYDETYSEEFSARYLKFSITLITSFYIDEYLSFDSAKLYNFVITYNQTKTAYLFLNENEENESPFQTVVSINSNNISSNEIFVGMAMSDSFNWNDYYNDSQPYVDENGKIVTPIRYVKEGSGLDKEPLNKIDRFVLKAEYGRWDPYSSYIVYDKDDSIISSDLYKVYPREGLIVFNNILPYNYVDGDYKIFVINQANYKIGLEINNNSNQNLEIYGIGYMYTSGKELLPPIEKLSPEVQDVLLDNLSPRSYDIISVDYTYFDSNYDVEDLTKIKIKWYINDVHVEYLDGYKTWNNIENENDPLFRNALSFTISDLAAGETVEEKARENGESILKVGDSIYCTIQVSDGQLYSDATKSDIAYVVETIPTVSQLEIKAIDSDGEVTTRIASNLTAFVTFNLNADTSVNNSTVIWYVNSEEFKRANYGDTNYDRILPGEVSINIRDVGLKMGNEIYVKVIPRTGTSDGVAISSSSEIVQNAYSEITYASILPESPREDNDLILTWTFLDFDIDALSDSSQYENTSVKWYVKNPPATAGQTTQFAEVTDANMLSKINTDIDSRTSTVDNSIISAGQEWKAVVTPNDGFDDGESKSVGPVTIISRYNT